MHVLERVRSFGVAKRTLRRPLQHRNERYHGLRLEPLEDRRMLSLLGIAPQLQLPLITYNSVGEVQYTAADEDFSVCCDTTPLFYVDPTYGPSLITAPSSFDINISVDNTGQLIGPGTSTDLVITGNIDVDGDTVIDFSGTLLTGKILEFGYEDSGGPTDQYDFRFQLTGGALASEYAGKDLGVTTTSEGSSFTGDFTVDFGGGAKGNVGAIEPLVTAQIDVEKCVQLVEAGGGEGLTPGYWKQPHHFDAWVGYTQDQSYNDVFGVNDPDDPTLLEALQRGGGYNKALGRHAVAALLNASNPNIDYAFTETQIISMVQDAYATGNFEAVKGQLEPENELGADLSDGGSSGAVGECVDADEAPGLIVMVGSEVMFTYTVTNPGDVVLENVTVTDDNETPSDPLDDFNPDPVLDGAYNVGDTNLDGNLDLGEEWLYTYSKIVTEGQHVNVATAVGTPLGGGEEVSDSDPAHWLGLTDVPDSSSISGFVYLDTNDDGVKDAGEGGIAGTTVQLTGIDADGNAVNLTTQTDVNGLYEFLNLLPGTYTVTEEQPEGYADGTDAAGTAGGTAGNDVVSGIQLGLAEDAVEYLFGEVPGATVQGIVWEDTDNDGEVDSGEMAIEDATVRLTGTNDRGEAIDLVLTTDADGVYIFTDLRPSDANGYVVEETQPAGFDDGMDVVGTVNGVPVGYVDGNDRLAGIVVGLGEDGENYNFAELAAQDGTYVAPGQTATIGFWQNKNGQNLIKSLNGGSSSTDFGNWLAVTFPNLYGADAGDNDLAGMTNAEVASFYKSIFKMKKKDRLPGPTKLDPQAMAVAIAVYVTNESLAGTVAQSYGFTTSADGVGAALFDIDAAVGDGSAETLFGSGTSSTLTVLEILQLTDGNSTNGIIYDDGDGEISSSEQMLRTLANELFTAINEAGDID